MAITIPSTTSVELAPISTAAPANVGDDGRGAIAAGFHQATDAFAEAQARMQQQRDATMVFNTLTQFGDAQRDKETEFSARTGAAAHGLHDDVSAWWESEPSKYIDTLENQQQKLVFQQEIAKRRDTSLDQFSRFQAAQEQQGLVDAGQSKLQLSYSDAARNFNDPAAIAKARQDAINTVDTLVYMKNGGVMEANEQAAARLEATTKIHSGVIENLAAANPTAANEYLTANKDEIDGTQLDNLKKVVAAADVLGAGQTAADKIWNKGLRSTAAFDEARKISDPKTREQALTLLRQQQAEVDEATNKWKEDSTNDAWDTFLQKGVGALSPKQVSFLEQHNPKALDTMRRTNPQDQVQTDWAKVTELSDLAKDNKVKFAQTDLRNYKGQLDAATLDHFSKLQEDVQKQLLDGSPPGDVATLEQQLTTAHARFDINGAKKAEQAGQFDQFVRGRIANEQKARGRALTEAERQPIIDGAAYELSRSGWFRGGQAALPDHAGRLALREDSR